MKRILCMSAVMLVGACSGSSSIQRDYQSNRNECQDMAEERISQYLAPNAMISEKDRNAQLVTLFSDCMFAYGWTVATPSREGEGAVSEGE